jgi:ATP-dependent DNA helicase
MYHGTPAERAEIRRTVMRLPNGGSVKGSKKGSLKKPAKRSQATSAKRRKSARLSNKVEREGDEEEKENIDNDKEECSMDVDSDGARFPVVVTTYEMVIKDRVHLSAYNFAYIGTFRQSFSIDRRLMVLYSCRRGTSFEEFRL